MKKALIYIIPMLCLSLAACEDTIEEFHFTNDSKLAVLGILNTSDSANRIYCYYMDGQKLSAVSDAKIKIYVNGSLAEEVSDYIPGNKFDTYDPEWYFCNWSMEEGTHAEWLGEEISYDDVHLVYDNKISNYLVKTRFKPGDKVRLEVSSESCNQSVWAETEVPIPAGASVVDTLYTMETIEQNGDDDPMDYYKVGLRITQSKPANYRLLAGFRICETYGIASINSYTFEKVEDFPDENMSVSKISIEVTDDIALTDGKGYYKADDDDFISMDIYYYNHFRIVSGEYFSGGQYNASFYINPMRSYDIPTWGGYSQTENGFLKGHIYKWLENEDDESGNMKVLYDKDHSEYLYYQVFTMPDVLFHYLKMRSSQNDVSFADSPFIEPVVLKGNINGGAGIFAIEAVTEGKIKLKTPIALPSKSLYY